MAKVDDAVRDLIYYHGKRAAREVLDELPDQVKEMRRELRDLRKTVDDLRAMVDVLEEHRREQMDIPPAPEEDVESSRVTRRTLTSIRKKFELSQDDLAELLDVASGTISLWENGESKPRSNNKARIITLRGMGKEKIDEILGRDGSEEEWSGERLRQIRDQQGLTQVEVAEKLDVSPNTISGWESGRIQPSKTNLQKIRDLEEQWPEQLSRQQFDGTRLREWREESDLSRAAVAELLDVSYASVQNWEAGETTPRGENLQKVEDLMATSPDELNIEQEESADREFDGGRLTELKQTFGIGQAELAELLGVTNATVWSWETGRTTPSQKNIKTVREVEEMSEEAVHEALRGGSETEKEAEEGEEAAPEAVSESE